MELLLAFWPFYVALAVAFVADSRREAPGVTIWTDNAARFATTRDFVEAQLEVVLANLEADLAAARAPQRSWTISHRLSEQRAALAIAAGPLERLSRASGRAGVWTRDLSWPARRRGGVR